ncbi:MAG TPA: GNAT family N-acetyltransferase [Actinomycetota bacterium]|nr:GNAT family N-acetyltransferase [Actinomycetota bacterium]
MADLRDANLPRDLESVGRLWLDYPTWGNDELETRYGFRLPVREAVDNDLATIAKFQPPDGRLLLAFEDDAAIGTACMRRIGPDTAEIKRMYVQPSHRRAGVGRAMLDELIAAARTAGYHRIQLDSPDFMMAAHGLYRSSGFEEIGSYPESEIPDEYKSHWVFMERKLT